MGNGDKRIALYHFHDANEQLLYIGITAKPGQRWEAHMRSQPWWPEVARQTVEWHADQEAALAAERAAIRRERPLYNARHSLGLSTLTLKTAWDCPVCGLETTDPVEQVEHMEMELTGKIGRKAQRDDVEHLARIIERTSNALDRAEASLARAQALFAHAARGDRKPRRPGRAPLGAGSAEVRKLVADLGQILGTDRVRLSELPSLLRRHDPDWLPYRKIRGTDLHALLRDSGIRVTNTGNVRRLDPADLPRQTA